MKARYGSSFHKLKKVKIDMTKTRGKRVSTGSLCRRIKKVDKGRVQFVQESKKVNIGLIWMRLKK